jgi:sugar phosphate isomerase/epimerase
MGPEIYLAIDNCFASRRWCEVDEWMHVIDDLGVHYVEASADNEIDPLYSCAAHVTDWLSSVERCSQQTGVRIVNCYSGHGTYSTLGLGHHDARVREHMKKHWIRTMIETAGRLHAGLGFSAHAFAEKTLRDRALYDTAYGRLIDDLRDLSVDAEREGVTTFGVEQMYTPHQVPWTIAGTADFLRRTNEQGAGAPVYITLDTGHQSGQRRFLCPEPEGIDRFIDAVRKGASSDIYLGPRECYDRFRDYVRSGAARQDIHDGIEEHVRGNSHLYASYEDGDTYRWLREFACCSPIIHLQQTDGTVSAHECFTAELNDWGIIRAEAILRAIQQNALRDWPEGFPPKVDRIYLTLEPFLPTASHPRIMLERIAESVAYWRRFIPEDGLQIDVLCAMMEDKETDDG